MLSPSAGAGSMSPMLSHASELAAAAAAASQGGADSMAGAPLGQQGAPGTPEPVLAPSFLSLSPITQWAQVGLGPSHTFSFRNTLLVEYKCVILLHKQAVVECGRKLRGLLCDAGGLQDCMLRS